jgi:predicted  nucleic acid-binding Zn-ribbon protein
MPDIDPDLYTCTVCGYGSNEPKQTRTCPSCGGVKTTKLTSALVATAQAKARVSNALEEDDLQGFAQARSDMIALEEKLKPPSSR